MVCPEITHFAYRTHSLIYDYPLVLAILPRWKKADLQTAFTCLSIDRNSSNQIPMFFAACEACIASQPTVIDSSGGRGRCQAGVEHKEFSLDNGSASNCLMSSSSVVISLMQDWTRDRPYLFTCTPALP